MLIYDLFFRHHGLYRTNHLLNPPINLSPLITLPKESLYHFIPQDVDEIGPSIDHWLIKHAERLIYIDHVEQLSSDATQGSPRRLHSGLDLAIKDYHRQYRRIKRIRDFQRDLKEPKTFGIINYGTLSSAYRYIKNYQTDYNRSVNLLKTIAERINLYGKIPAFTRQQFVEISLTNSLPALRTMHMAAEKMSRELTETFSPLDRLVVFEFWKWLGPQRNESLFNAIDSSLLEKTNIIITHYNRWILINLGVFDEWRKGADQEQGDIQPDAMQKRFLKTLSLFKQTDLEIDQDNEQSEEILSQPPKSATVTPSKATEKESLEPEDPLKKVLEISGKEDEAIEEELNLIETLSNKRRADKTSSLPPAPTDPVTAVKSVIEQYTEEDILSVSDYKRFQTLAEKQSELKNPFAQGEKNPQTLFEAMEITPKSLEINGPVKVAKVGGVFDESMFETTLQEFDSRYIREVMEKDVLRNVMALSNNGVIVTDYKSNQSECITGETINHAVSVQPIGGKPSTLWFKLPKVEENGTFKVNGIHYRLRKQRVDLPIRKVKPNRVVLTSYYGRSFVTRSEKIRDDYTRWLIREIRELYFDKEQGTISHLKNGVGAPPTVDVPRVYGILSQHFLTLTTQGIECFFHYKKRHDVFDAETLERVEKNGSVVFGKKKDTVYYFDQNSVVYKYKKGESTSIGFIEEFLSIDRKKAPTEFAQLSVFSKKVPLAIVLSYYLGIDQFLTLLPTHPKRLTIPKMPSAEESEFAIGFNDSVLIFDKDDPMTRLLAGGFLPYAKFLKTVNINDFNSKDVYFNLFESQGLSQRYLNELDLLRNLFIDPITKDVLVSMGEPDEWIRLLMRAGEMLTTESSPDETDMSNMRIAGYERVPGAVYQQLVQSLRDFHGKRGNRQAKIELKPYAVWQAVTQGDSARIQVEMSNPIKNVNESEALTFLGTGGRSRDTMVDRTRVYHKTDMGVISEATVDSGDVAINTYLTANPALTSLRGLTERHQREKSSSSRLLSTSMLLAPGADTDDPKRVNFITIQNAQSIGALGYQPAPLRTGYDKILAQRTDDIFCAVAQEKGTVEKVSKEAITVNYDSGKTQRLPLGTQYGKSSALTIPHPLKTSLKKGDTVEPGDALTYNSVFFQPDTLNPKEVVGKFGVMCKVALLESNDTYEDSSAISESIAKKFRTRMTHVRHLFFDFDQAVKNLVEIGSEVNPETVLCTIEDDITVKNELFDEDSLDTLKLLAGNTPRANYTGTVEKIEILYYGDKEDMSPSLRALVTESDKRLEKEQKALGLTTLSGSINDSLRIDNQIMELDQLVINVYVTETVDCGIGDKLVFANQMKSIIARVMGGENKTETGEPIDAMFGYVSLNARIVLSPEIMGTTNTLLRLISKRVGETYFDKSK